MSVDSPPNEEMQQVHEDGLLVYKIVAVEGSLRTSMSMAGACSAIYSQEQVTLPPLLDSPLFAYRTLEVATCEYVRIKEINASYAMTAHIQLELWQARTSGEVRGPDRIPHTGAWYSSLLKHARLGSGLYGCYVFFWQNVSFCLKHCIGKRAGWKINPAVTVCCKDLILLEQLTLQGEVNPCL